MAVCFVCGGYIGNEESCPVCNGTGNVDWPTMPLEAVPMKFREFVKSRKCIICQGTGKVKMCSECIKRIKV